MEFGDRSVGSDRPDAVRLVDVHARLNRVWAELLDLVPELDSDEAWLRNSATDMAAWLQFELGMAPRTARQWVRVGNALAGLPQIAKAFRSGAVSFDEVVVLCRFASAENEGELLELTRHLAVGELAAAIKELLGRVSAEEPVDPRRGPELRMWWDESDVLQVRGRVPGADGVMVETALVRLASQAPVDAATGLFRDPVVREGEALVQMSSESLASDGDHDRATVVVHVSATELADPDAMVKVAGKQLTRDDLLRMTCDGRVQPAVDDSGGFTLGIGRVSRQVPAWLRRLLDDRDGGCRFPGCQRTRWLHAHHLVHWANGGPTNLDNLVLLCGFHHRLIHRQGWEIVGNPGSDLTWLNQWGRAHEPARPPLNPDLLSHAHWSSDYWHSESQRLVHANAPP